MLTVRKVAGALGAEIGGVDLSGALSDADIAAIRAALNEHQVIFFRDQTLSPEQQLAFGRRFGPLNIHPYVTGMADHPEEMEIIKEPTDRLNFGGGWHSDMSFLETPSIGSILYAVESADFLYLQRETGLTKGNLSSHLGKLEEAGYVQVEKTYRGKVPLTICRLSDTGRAAFETYRKQLKTFIEQTK